MSSKYVVKNKKNNSVHNVNNNIPVNTNIKETSYGRLTLAQGSNQDSDQFKLLLKEVMKLKAENAKLKAENGILKGRCGVKENPKATHMSNEEFRNALQERGTKPAHKFVTK